MSITANASQKPRILTPAGTFIARCYQIWDMGTQEETDFKTGAKKMYHKIRLVFELPTKTHTFDEAKGPQPFSIGIDYNLFMNEQANLRKTIQDWTGHKMTDKEANEFDMLSLLGKPCTLTVGHKTAKSTGNEYAFIAAITPPMDGVTIPPPHNENFEFDFNEHFENFDRLPKWFQDKIAATIEYANAKNPAKQTVNMDAERKAWKKMEEDEKAKKNLIPHVPLPGEDLNDLPF